VGTLLAAVALVAASAWVGRKVTRSRRRKAAGRLPGASLENPFEVSSFTEIDRALRARRCWCGGGLVLEGEGSRDAGGRSAPRGGKALPHSPPCLPALRRRYEALFRRDESLSL